MPGYFQESSMQSARWLLEILTLDYSKPFISVTGVVLFSSPLQSRSLFSASFQTFCLIEYAKIWTVLQSRGQGGKFPNFFLVCRHTLLPTVHMLLQKQVPIQCAQPVIVVLSEMIERINVEKCTKIWTSGSLPLSPPSFPFHPFHVPPSVRSVILPPWYRLFITAVVCKCLGN